MCCDLERKWGRPNQKASARKGAEASGGDGARSSTDEVPSSLLSEPYGSVRGNICRFVRFDLVIRRERGVCWKYHLDEGAAVVDRLMISMPSNIDLVALSHSATTTISPGGSVLERLLASPNLALIVFVCAPRLRDPQLRGRAIPALALFWQAPPLWFRRVGNRSWRAAPKDYLHRPRPWRG
jgi:hypothetical protein